MFRVTPASCASCAAGKVGFFAKLSDPAIERIVGISRMLRFSKFQIIKHEEDAPMIALILRSGMIKISHALTDGRLQIVDFLTTGDVLIQPVGDSVVPMIAEATTDVDAYEVGLTDLEALCAESPELSQSLLSAVFGEIDRKNHQVMMLGRMRSYERVAAFLLDFSDRAARRGEPTNRLKLRMSRADIADYLCLTAETVSRAFTLLKEEGILQLPKSHEVVIFDVAGLLEIAGGRANLSVR